MDAIKYVADSGLVWVRNDNLEWELGNILYLSPKDTIDNYQQVEPKPEEVDENGEIIQDGYWQEA